MRVTASSWEVSISSTTSKPSLVTLKHCFPHVTKSSLLPSFSGYGSFLHAWQRNLMRAILLNKILTIVSCYRQQYYHGLSQKLLLYPQTYWFDWVVFIDIKHNAFSATGISWLYCNQEYALGNVPKCPVVDTYLIYQAHTIYNACWWQWDRFGWCYSSFNMSCYSWFVCFRESTITIRQCPK